MTDQSLAVGADLSAVASVDHYVDSLSRSPSFEGLPIRLFVRQRIVAARAAGRPVLFVHGGAFPGVPDFDLPYQDYSWMAYLAAAGFDAYAIDLTGYGRSTRPHMDDPCNVVPLLRPLIGGGACTPSFAEKATSLASDWADIDAVVEFIRARSGAGTVDLIGWSGGGPRVGGYAALHPEKVGRVVLLAPAYLPTEGDISFPDLAGGPTAISTYDTTMARWDAGVAGPDQYDPAIRKVIWDTNLAMDPVGAGWGPGAVRFPTSIDRYIWPAASARKFTAPVLMLVGDQDVEVPPEQVRRLYDDIGSDRKVLVHLGGSSHFAVYERVYRRLHAASRDWLMTGEFHGSGRAIFEIDREGGVGVVD